MKKILLISILALLGMSQAAAQNEDPNDYLPLVRDGVKWVNERVIVDNGDTTKYYYSYEIDGSFTYENYGTVGNFRACHYYEFSGQSDAQDSIISGLEQSGPDVLFWMNDAQTKICLEDRNLLSIEYTPGVIPGKGYLYFFSYGRPMGVIHYYLERQREQFLTEDNFIQIESLNIEGSTCRRYAYLGEDGEPLAYVVEGIGFDSRDLGDLLTPFTRKPDPNADYQEWCGLCHVVKDGRVIYKGMRYTPDNMTGIDEVVADQRPRHYDGNYYDLTGRCMGTEVPTTPGIYIHNGNKICVSRMQ